MGNSYCVQTYGEFANQKKKKVTEEFRAFNKFARQWNEAVKRLKESGADLSRIRIVTK